MSDQLTGQQFSHLAASRHSVRDFAPTPVPPELLDQILNDATTAASWSNTRPYMLALATGDQADRIRAAYVAEYDRVLPVQRGNWLAAGRLGFTRKLPDGDFGVMRKYPADLNPARMAVGKALYQHLGIARDDKAAREEANRQNFRAFNAPVIGFVFVHKKFQPFAPMDAGLMLATLMLSAKSRGLDTCALGSLALWRRPVDSEFDIPKNYGLITGFALGYASDHHVNDFRADRPKLRIASSKKGQRR